MATTIEAPKSSMYDLLEKRYATDQGWLLLYEVANGTGFKGTGYADALAFSIWPSRGIALHGFELKQSRTDLLKELRDENKANHFLKYCQFWWLVVSDAKLVQGVEVPTTWGILAPRNNILYQVRAAPKLEAEAWKPEFIAALMRRFHEAHIAKDQSAARAHVEERARKMFNERVARQDTSELTAAKQEAENARRAYSDLNATVQEFTAKSGIPVSSWNAEHIGELVHAIMNDKQHPRLRRALEEARDNADRISKSAASALKNLESLAKVAP